jgi:hypothetical protein
MLKCAFTILVSLALGGASFAVDSSPITYLGKAVIPGTATDLSGLTDTLEDGAPHNRLGAVGSGIDYTGEPGRYVMAPDRGPADGSDHYKCRLQTVRIDLPQTDGRWNVTCSLVATTMLTDQTGKCYVGAASEIDNGLRFDPEGVRVTKSGTVFVSDEYGPSIREFDRTGKQTGRVIFVPSKFLVDHPLADPNAELTHNTKGRQANRGMEGLALSPDGKVLTGIMQSPLLQDQALDGSLKRIGCNIRMLEIDLTSGSTREYVYALDDKSNGVNEILALNHHEYLVLERDGKAGSEAAVKKIYRVDTDEATDVSAVDHLPSSGVPNGVRKVSKRLFLDLLSPDYPIKGEDTPDKFEGMTFGPDLPDGRRLLLVSTDNDFHADRPCVIYAFAVRPDYVDR